MKRLVTPSDGDRAVHHTEMPSHYCLTDEKGCESQCSSSVRSMSRSTVVSRNSKRSFGSKSSKSVRKRVMGKMKSVTRRKEKKRSLNGSSMDPVPETVSAQRNRLSDKLAKSSAEEKQSVQCRVDPLIHMVLFLIDSNATRFEILLLNFDSSRARVWDVLKQIKVSSKDDFFLKHRFSGIADEEGYEMIDSRKLSDYTSAGWAVCVAIPDGMTSMESAKIASPLIKDPRVGALLERHQSSEQLQNRDLRASSNKSVTSPSATEPNSPVPQYERTQELPRIRTVSLFPLSFRQRVFVAILLALVVAFFIFQRGTDLSLEQAHISTRTNSERIVSIGL
mmetsp:Transcript_28313/g.83332  ORF Transcript_28313/g.83332 Transcript_28313/m.83332 type:complete len:336 (-) Transcript_28313:353-1360(-)